MRTASLLLALAALASCSKHEAPPSNAHGADDFASRVGASVPASGVPTVASGATAAKATAAVAMNFKPGEEPYAMQTLGDASRVDLGPKSGGCVLNVGGVQMMQATAPLDRTLPGKAVVRIGGQLLTLDSPPGGIALVKSGTDYRGEGFRVEVRPDGKGHAKATVVDIEGETHVVNGDWNCV